MYRARAGVVELADTSDLGSGAERLGGSNPLARKYKEIQKTSVFLGRVGTNLASF